MPDWNRILDEFGPAVWKTALRMLGNESDAADCLQTVMLEAFEVSQRQSVRNWPALLKQMTTVRALDMLRSRYRHAARQLPDVEPHDPTATQVSEQIDNRDLAEHLRREISRLPPDQAEAFSLRWIDGLSNREIALMMEITASHVGVLIHRARATLRHRLSRNDEE